MSTSAPLSHITVLIMRAEAQAQDMAESIRKRGGTPLTIPLLQIVPTHVSELRPIEDYSWIIFTSTNTVRFFLSLMGEDGIPSSVRLAAVGEKTKRALEKQGYTVHFVPQEFVAETFVQEFAAHVTKDDRILFPKGNLARDVIPSALREQGTKLDEVIVYETKQNRAMQQQLIETLQHGRANVLAFTSPSTVTQFIELLEETNWREWVKHCTIACIGPVTAQAARQYFSNVLVSDTYTIDGLIMSLEKHFANRTQ